MSFATEVARRLPRGMRLPEAFAAVFDWAEARGQSGLLTHADQDAFESRYLTIYPLDAIDEEGASHVLFRLDGPPFAEPIPEAVTARLVCIADAAGDGGKLGFWLDDAGKQWVVVIDHGTPYVLTDDPLIALQFLAMGYPEPAALQDADLTPAQVARDWGAEPLIPDDYRAFLAEAFGLQIPARAADLGITIPAADDTTDPARIWLSAAMPEQGPDIPLGTTPEHPFVIGKDIAEHLDDETLQALMDTFEHVVIEQ